MSRVLVTGATGFVGPHAVTALRRRGHEVLAVGSRDADLLDPGGASRLIHRHRPEVLLHLAWYAEPGAYWTSVENVRWVEASLRLLRAFASVGGRRAVLAGTSAEYDWSGEAALREGVTPLRPSTLYGVAKDALRRVAESFCAQEGLSFSWGRVFFLYGPGEDPRRLVSSVARALTRGEEARTSRGHQIRDFLHVADVGAAFAALVDTEVTGAVNVASGEAHRISEVVSLIGRAAGREELLRVGALPDRPDDPPRIVADIARLRDEAGWRPSWPLDEGIADTVAWWTSR